MNRYAWIVGTLITTIPFCFLVIGSVRSTSLYHVSIAANCQGRAPYDGATTSDVCPTECDATSTIKYTKQIIWQ